MAHNYFGKSPAISVFQSELGWMAVATSPESDTVLRLVFGFPSPLGAWIGIRNDLFPVETLEPDPESERLHSPLVRRLQAYAAGAVDDFLDVKLESAGATPFQLRVIEACRRIPYGETVTYGELAASVDSPNAGRAVGNVMSGNQVPLIVPCHRVVAAGGKLGNYSGVGGTKTKTRLLRMEAESLCRRPNGKKLSRA